MRERLGFFPSFPPSSLLASLPLSIALSLARSPSLHGCVHMKEQWGSLLFPATPHPHPLRELEEAKQTTDPSFAACTPFLFPCQAYAPGFCVVQTGHQRAQRATKPNDHPSTPAFNQDPGMSLGKKHPNLLSGCKRMRELSSCFAHQEWCDLRPVRHRRNFEVLCSFVITLSSAALLNSALLSLWLCCLLLLCLFLSCTFLQFQLGRTLFAS